MLRIRIPVDFGFFIDNIKKSIQKGLPGQSAQQKMSPPFRNPAGHNESEYFRRQGAVLILLYPDNNSVGTVLIERTEYGGHHSNQISFPGGKKEKGDETLYHTALRETEEEIGVPKDKVTFIGKITSLYIPVSNFEVSPFIGYVPQKPVFNFNAREVKSIVEMDVGLLNNERIKGRKKINLANGLLMETPYYDIGGKTVWGATAMILSEFQEIINVKEEKG